MADKQLEEAQQLDSEYLIQTFGRKPVEFVRGEGVHLYDTEGREYLDFLSGIGVVSVGHCNPQVTKAIQDQAGKLLHVSNYYYVEHRGEVAKALATLLAGDSGEHWRVFFANSGAEANEGMIKLARLWGKAHLDGAYGIITAKKSFHGRTLATLSATAQDAKQDPFAPLPGGFTSVPLNDIEALEAALDAPMEGENGMTRPCALMLEVVQGESGVWPCTEEYLQAARKLTADRGVLLILDEVQCGLFRCGTPFAYQGYGVQPDIVSMAKGIADGVPMGAFGARDEIAQMMKPGMHGSTFGGSPLACAASEATLSIMSEEGFAEHVLEVGEYLRAKLACLPFISDVRGRGLMVGVTLDKPVAGALVMAGLKHGLVLNAPASDIIRLLPPLIIEKKDVDTLIDALPTCYEEACNA